MRNLYEVKFEHFGKSRKELSKRGVFSLVVARTDEEVYEWLKNGAVASDGSRLNTKYREIERYDSEYKADIIRMRGDLHDKELDTELFYEVTLTGWELKKEDISNDEVESLKQYGVGIVVL